MSEKENKKSGCFLRSCFLATGGLVGIIVFLMALPVIAEVILWMAGGYLIVADPLQEADAIVVLSGGEDDSRLEEAAKLYENGYADWVILTETGEMVPNRADMTLSQYEREKIIKMGVPQEAIITTEKIVSSTWGEARVVMKLVLGRGMKSAIIVTDPFHTRRTRMVFRDVFLPRDLTVITHPVVGHWYKSATWWTSEEGRTVTIDEYAKLFGYMMGLKED